MDLQQAQDLLNTCKRSELRDHAFGDTEIYWDRDGDEVGGGYFGSGESTVWIGDDASFTGEDARQLRNCAASVQIERNDETGPDTYAEGVTMPGLTLEGVREELTGWGSIVGRINLDGSWS